MGTAGGPGERGLDVLYPVRHRVPVEVGGPGGRMLASAEPRRRGSGERAQHLRVYAAVPRHHGSRTPSAPAPVDEAIDLAHVQAAQLRGPPLPADDAYSVRLPVDDVDEGVLNRPRVARGRAGDAPPPVRRAQPYHQTVEPCVLAPGPREDTLARVPHVEHVTAPRHPATVPHRLVRPGSRHVGVGIIVTCIGLGAMLSLSVFLQPMAQAMGWSRTGITTGG
jgi:hypothetical protein